MRFSLAGAFCFWVSAAEVQLLFAGLQGLRRLVGKDVGTDSSDSRGGQSDGLGISY